MDKRAITTFERYKKNPSQKGSIRTFFYNQSKELNADDYYMLFVKQFKKHAMYIIIKKEEAKEGMRLEKIIPREPKIKEKGEYKNFKYLKKKKKTKVRKCTKCKKEFVTEVDDRGIAYKTRCERCKKAEACSAKTDTGFFIGKDNS